MENKGITTCSRCGGRGIYIKGNIAFKCSCLQEYAKLQRFSQARLPAKLQKHTFKRFDFGYYPADAFNENGKSFKEVAQNVQQPCPLPKKISRALETKGCLFTAM